MFLEPPIIVPISFGREVFDEGDYAQVSCVVSSGDLPLSITWSLQGVSVQGGSETGIATAPMGPRASFLSIQSVSSQHSGVYTCTARNTAGTSSYSTSLIVNGNFFSKKKKRVRIVEVGSQKVQIDR